MISSCAVRLSLELLLVALVPLACKHAPSQHDGGIKTCPFGDQSKPIELHLVARDNNGGLLDITESSTVPLLLAPQGGYVAFVGVRATNLDGCGLQLSASIRDDACTKKLLTLETRPVDLTAGANGLAEPESPVDLFNFANLASCPIAGLDRPVDGPIYLLHAAVMDHAGKMGEVQAHVTLSCMGDMLCECACSNHVQLGSRCSSPPADSGLLPNQCAPDSGVGD
jgi:hypothetical protein